jgi:hypothetical protein
MGWLRKQPVPTRKHGNPERTYANKVGHVAIFLKAFGASRLLKKSEYPQYEEKMVSAHTDDELGVLYGHANAEDIFLLDFFIGTMARDHEGYRCRFRDLTGTTLTVYGKHHKTRTVEVSQRLADTINDRRKRKKADHDDLLFANRNGKPDQHLLRRLQRIAKRAGAKFHTELHKLRKTGASRRYLAGVPLPSLMLELGHESLGHHAEVSRRRTQARRSEESRLGRRFHSEAEDRKEDWDGRRLRIGAWPMTLGVRTLVSAIMMASRP